MTVPAYAGHLSEEIYLDWKTNWKRFDRGLQPSSDGNFILPQIPTVQDARALIAIAALDDATREALDRGSRTTGLELTNYGQSIETIAALFQYHSKEAAEAVIELAQSLGKDGNGFDGREEFYIFAYLINCGIPFNPADEKSLEALKNMAAYADGLELEPVTKPCCALGREQGYARIENGIRQYYSYNFYDALAYRIIAARDVIEVPSDLVDTGLKAAFKYLNHSGAISFNLRDVVEVFASDADIVEHTESITQMYRRDFQGRYESLIQHRDAGDIMREAKTNMREQWLEVAGGSLSALDIDRKLSAMPNPRMAYWDIQFPRLTPGGKLLPAVDWETEDPEMVEDLRHLSGLAMQPR